MLHNERPLKIPLKQGVSPTGSETRQRRDCSLLPLGTQADGAAAFWSAGRAQRGRQTRGPWSRFHSNFREQSGRAATLTLLGCRWACCPHTPRWALDFSVSRVEGPRSSFSV